jgi:molecular chaperone GrpE
MTNDDPNTEYLDEQGGTQDSDPEMDPHPVEVEAGPDHTESSEEAGLQDDRPVPAEGEESEEDEGEEPVSELEAAQEELKRLRDQHPRLAADFENYRKRANAELTGNWIRARADLVRSLVEGLDDLQRVSQFTSDDTTVDALIEGVDLVERNLLKALMEAGLEVLDPVGERFDPNSMEAMMRVPTEEEGQEETVHQVFQKGYLFKDQLVRPARVSVYMDED